jgi:hypothetical protein
MNKNKKSPRFGNRYGITKLKNDNYLNWSFRCQMVLSHFKVGKIVNGEHLRLPTIEQRKHEFAEEALQTIAEQLSLGGTNDNSINKARDLTVQLTDVEQKKFQKVLDEWDEKDQEAL